MPSYQVFAFAADRPAWRPKKLPSAMERPLAYPLALWGRPAVVRPAA